MTEARPRSGSRGSSLRGESCALAILLPSPHLFWERWMSQLEPRVQHRQVHIRGDAVHATSGVQFPAGRGTWPHPEKDKINLSFRRGHIWGSPGITNLCVLHARLRAPCPVTNCWLSLLRGAVLQTPCPGSALSCCEKVRGCRGAGGTGSHHSPFLFCCCQSALWKRGEFERNFLLREWEKEISYSNVKILHATLFRV